MGSPSLQEYIKAKKRIEELEKEHPEYKGRLYCFYNNQIFETSNTDYHIYLKIE